MRNFVQNQRVEPGRGKMAAEDLRLPALLGFWGDEHTLKEKEKLARTFLLPLRVKQV